MIHISCHWLNCYYLFVQLWFKRYYKYDRFVIILLVDYYTIGSYLPYRFKTRSTTLVKINKLYCKFKKFNANENQHLQWLRYCVELTRHRRRLKPNNFQCSITLIQRSNLSVWLSLIRFPFTLKK